MNRYKLEELDRVRQLPANTTKTNIDLVWMFGFSSHHSYLKNPKRKKGGMPSKTGIYVLFRTRIPEIYRKVRCGFEKVAKTIFPSTFR